MEFSKEIFTTSLCHIGLANQATILSQTCTNTIPSMDMLVGEKVTTVWRRLIGCLKLQVMFRLKAPLGQKSH